ncbi:hypothetical protein A3Q56_03141 [Intoshia linei]|uniref:Uncharacterized protein n=1 Tax=Intoshia linei TaxID=1819745 RepID=A0A177B640_9BILA|nr:hypothetical protein A3Q56_03141 [Intoshia linei]
MELNYNKIKKFQNSLRRDANQCEQFTQTTVPNSKQIDVSISQTHILENTIKSLENQLKLNLKNQSEYEKLKLNYEKNFKESKDEQDVIKNENVTN